ncbi:uncharacterized protein L969DRAFT_96358 [Mixia osmundae IAM 14324]|uniref:uncharacterized protein n=1 Tax=Mixia osmundae (strain CBS 9802 / IAM 14324 / JCM 22182 / KY 12970) TaxID=764103 RepID=UPI0004A55580|nr:uncharacterized protein L969DRAFT_96358 [Mixia osmundae IAM 14324]KEI37272.1 hypothetical protein L969DRAFT_96358 [Mixia osmundae IAM 14324]
MSSDQQSPAWSLPLLSLVMLAVQNTFLVLVIYAVRRKARLDGTPPFTPSAALLFSESAKFLICIVLSIIQSRGILPACRSARQYLEQTKLAKQMAVPAAVYLVQNLLLYVAMGNLDPVTFQVTYQLKLAATALFSVVLLGRTFTKQQYLAMALLTLGILAIQLDQPKASLPAPTSNATSTAAVGAHIARALLKRSLFTRAEEEVTVDTGNAQLPNALLGVLATVTSAFTSGFAGVYFEKVLKKDQNTTSDQNGEAEYDQLPTEDEKDLSTDTTLTEESITTKPPRPVSILVMTNLILSFYTILALPFVIAALKGPSGLRLANLTTGFEPLVWLIVLWQAMGGLLIAVVIKYADNVLKTFAITASIIASALIQIFAFGLRPGPIFASGVLLSIASSWLYNHRQQLAFLYLVVGGSHAACSRSEWPLCLFRWQQQLHRSALALQASTVYRHASPKTAPARFHFIEGARLQTAQLTIEADSLPSKHTHLCLSSSASRLSVRMHVREGDYSVFGRANVRVPCNTDTNSAGCACRHALMLCLQRDDERARAHAVTYDGPCDTCNAPSSETRLHASRIAQRQPCLATRACGIAFRRAEKLYKGDSVVLLVHDALRDV